MNINKFPALIRNRVNNRWRYNCHWHENLRYKCKVVYWVCGGIFSNCNDSERQVWRCFILYNVNQRQIHTIIFIFIIIIFIIIITYSIMYVRRRWNIHGLYKVSQTLMVYYWVSFTQVDHMTNLLFTLDTQQNSYSISHLLGTVTTQWLPLWRCCHCSLVPDTVTTQQWLHRTHTLLGIHYHGAYVEICLLYRYLVGNCMVTTWADTWYPLHTVTV